MSLYFRLIWLLLSFGFRPKLVPPFGVSTLNFRVWPNDLDTNLHMNNGRYLTLMDLGRVDLILRGGMWKIIAKNRGQPILSGAIIRYRRELKPFQQFTLQSRIVYWSDKNFVMEQVFLAKDTSGKEIIAAKALVRGGIYSRKDRHFVDVAKLFADIGYMGTAPLPSTDVETFLSSEEALKRG
jgi:acyl-CoA thioesterase FadM